MECMEARALKSSSFISEGAMKSATNNNNNGFPEDFWCLTSLPAGAGTGEEFSIDEFFDLPNEENNDGFGNFLEEEEELLEEEEEKDSCSLSVSSQDHIVDDSYSNSPVFSPDLAIPVDDMQELELWSHLMDDSVPEATLVCPNPNPNFNAHKKETGFHFANRFEPGYKAVHSRASFMPSAVPVKPRSKRPRTVSNCSWAVHASSPKTESSSSSSSSCSSQLSSLLFNHPVHEMGMFFGFGKPPMKKLKKKPALVYENETSSHTFAPVLRRCTHCQVTKTPQWRAGPNGPKTLCNACGVRYKSGRLFPEYRPAGSPTFKSEIHSNSHRKVLEMRKKREMVESPCGSTLTLSPTTVLSS